MSEIVERAARAIYDAPNGIDGDQIADMLLVADQINAGTRDEIRAQIMGVCRQAARAAIAALREPTPAMVEAGTEALWSDCPMAGTAWRAMIDAALETQKAAAPEGTADAGGEQ